MNLELKHCIDKSKVVSFDIFDTLLYRPFVEPSDIFRFIERKYNIPGYKKNRQNAEFQARMLNGISKEITVEQIVNLLPDKFKPYFSKELALEKQVLKKIEDSFEAYNYALSKGKRVFITSDMYLSEEFLRECLTKNGITGYEKLIVSSRYGTRKEDGELFYVLLSSANVEPNQILHVGDNLNSDVIQPSLKGLNTYFFEKRINIFFKENKKMEGFYLDSNKNLDASIICALSCFENFPSKNYWTNFGFNIAGPIYAGYAAWIFKQVAQYNSNILFLLRDGFNLKKIFDLLYKSSKIKTNYLYVPRNLSLSCTLEFDKYFSVGTENGISALNSLIRFYSEYHKEFKNQPPIRTLEEAENFINSNQKKLELLKSTVTKKFRSYLQRVVGNSESIFIVDSFSQSLSAQQAVSEVLKVNETSKQIQGLYWFTLLKEPNLKKKCSFKEFQKVRGHQFNDWNLMEFIFSAPIPPVLNIDPFGNPITSPLDKWTENRIKTFPSMSHGADDFINSFLKYFSVDDLSFDASTLTTLLNSFINYPNTEDKENFNSIRHAWDPAHSRFVHIPMSWYPEVETFSCSRAVSYSYKKKVVLAIIKFLTSLPMIKLEKQASGQNLKLLNKITIASLERGNNFKEYRILGFTVRKRPL